MLSPDVFANRLERLVRTSIMDKDSPVEIIAGSVVGVEPNADGTAVQSVRVRLNEGNMTVIPATLLVDA